MVQNLNYKNQLQKEIVILAIPRCPKLTDIDDVAGLSQTSILPCSIEKICYSSLLCCEGWKRLPSISAILQNVTFEMNEYTLDRSCPWTLIFIRYVKYMWRH